MYLQCNCYNESIPQFIYIYIYMYQSNLTNIISITALYKPEKMLGLVIGGATPA